MDDESWGKLLGQDARAMPPGYPPLTEQARNLAGAVGRFASTWGETTNLDERARRLDICKSNKCGRYSGGRCLECGCRLRLKIAMASEHCPLDPPRW